MAGSRWVVQGLCVFLSQAGIDGGAIPWIRPREVRAFWDVKSVEIPTGVHRARCSFGAQEQAVDRPRPLMTRGSIARRYVNI
jgi:hypothetical protein